MKRVSLPNYISRSGAHFETTERFLKNSTVVNSSESNLKSAGVPLTHIDENTYATSKDELHCFIIGDSGCGKTRRVILPTIHFLSKAGESMVISDPKGELYRTTSQVLREKGYLVQVLNFRSPSKGNRWNPLGLIDVLYHKGDRESRDKSLMMLSDIVDVLQQDLKGKDPFWAMAAADVLRGVSLFILEYGEPGELTFENIASTARGVLKQLGSPQFREFIASLPKGSAIEQNLSVIITNANDTRNCIMAEFEAMISLYCSQESLKDLFVTSEIDVSVLGKKPTALFFILPDDTEALYPIATVFVKQIYSTLISLADEQSDGRLPNRVTFLLDEFANFARMPSIESMLTAARSRRIRFILVCQSMDQLTSKYQEHGRETLLANCRTWIYMSCRNLPFLERLEKLVGYYISPYTNERCPLVDISELQHFEMGQVLVLNDRCKPVMGYLPDYSEYDFGVDGRGASSEIPAPQTPVERKLFDMDKAYQKAKVVNAPIVEQKKREAQQESDGLRASILGKIAEKRSHIEDSDEHETKDVPVDLSSLFERLSRSDEPMEEKQSVTDLFVSGDYLAAAKQGIEDVKKSGGGILSTSAKNNLVFIMRFGGINASKLTAPFSLKYTDLLAEGIKNNEEFSILNCALCEIHAKHFKKAKELLLKMTKSDWASVLSFWHSEVWVGKKHHPEGAFVCYLANKFFNFSFDDIFEMSKIVHAEYSDFVASEHFKELLDHFDSTDVIPSVRESGEDKDDDAGSTLADLIDLFLVDDDVDDDKTEDDECDAVDIAAFRAQLQKKIKEKLNDKKTSPLDEDDED